MAMIGREGYYLFERESLVTNLSREVDPEEPPRLDRFAPERKNCESSQLGYSKKVRSGIL
jgi:hypothetical protein